MNRPTYSNLKLAAVFVTLCVIVGHHFLPDRRTVIDPSGDTITSIYADESWGGKSNAEWVDRGESRWRCHLKQSEVYPVCGWALSFAPQEGGTRDLSHYHSLKIHLRYTGEASKLRLYVRNHNPTYSELSDPDSLKFNSVVVRTADFSTGAATIALSEFSVADWWLDERGIAREWSAPEYDRVHSVGIDYPFPQVYGRHDMSIEQIELVGDWINAERLHLSLTLFWLAVATSEVFVRLNRNRHVK